ncbi:MAG TPA: hypothetical protein VLH15_02390 [Dehalococcoidales bacterium]|nr:hypothetical protein [Dehalococcoidales bacterium]
MGLFKRKKEKQAGSIGGPQCSVCGSVNVNLKVNYAGEQPDYIKTWRGRRYLPYHCRDCQIDFNVPEEKFGIMAQNQIDDGMIDEEALKAAEDELRKEMDEEGDRRCR